MVVADVALTDKLSVEQVCVSLSRTSLSVVLRLVASLRSGAALPMRVRTVRRDPEPPKASSGGGFELYVARTTLDVDVWTVDDLEGRSDRPPASQLSVSAVGFALMTTGSNQQVGIERFRVGIERSDRFYDITVNSNGACGKDDNQFAMTRTPGQLVVHVAPIDVRVDEQLAEELMLLIWTLKTKLQTELSLEQQALVPWPSDPRGVTRVVVSGLHFRAERDLGDPDCAVAHVHAQEVIVLLHDVARDDSRRQLGGCFAPSPMQRLDFSLCALEVVLAGSSTSERQQLLDRTDMHLGVEFGGVPFVTSIEIDAAALAVHLSWAAIQWFWYEVLLRIIIGVFRGKDAFPLPPQPRGDDLRSGLFTVATGSGARPEPLELSAYGKCVAWTYPHERAVVRAEVGSVNGVSSLRLQRWDENDGYVDVAHAPGDPPAVLGSPDVTATTWRITWDGPASPAEVARALRVNPFGDSTPSPPPHPIGSSVVIAVRAGHVDARWLVGVKDGGERAIEVSQVQVEGLHLAMNKWGRFALRVGIAGIFRVALMDLMSMAFETLIEPVCLKLTVDRIAELHPDDCRPVPHKELPKPGFNLTDLLGATASAASDLPRNLGTAVSIGSDELVSTHVSDSLLAALRLMIASVKRSGEDMAAPPDRTAAPSRSLARPPAHAAALVVENLCPAAIVFGQVGVDEEALEIAAGGQTPYTWSTVAGFDASAAVREVHVAGGRASEHGAWSEPLRIDGAGTRTCVVSWPGGTTALVSVNVRLEDGRRWRTSLRPSHRLVSELPCPVEVCFSGVLPASVSAAGPPRTGELRMVLGAGETRDLFCLSSQQADLAPPSLRVLLGRGDGWSVPLRLPVSADVESSTSLIVAGGMGAGAPQGSAGTATVDGGLYGWIGLDVADGVIAVRLSPLYVLRNGMPFTCAVRFGGTKEVPLLETSVESNGTVALPARAEGGQELTVAAVRVDKADKWSAPLTTQPVPECARAGNKGAANASASSVPLAGSSADVSLPLGQRAVACVVLARAREDGASLVHQLDLLPRATLHNLAGENVALALDRNSQDALVHVAPGELAAFDWRTSGSAAPRRVVVGVLDGSTWRWSRPIGLELTEETYAPLSVRCGADDVALLLHVEATNPADDVASAKSLRLSLLPTVVVSNRTQVPIHVRSSQGEQECSPGVTAMPISRWPADMALASASLGVGLPGTTDDGWEEVPLSEACGLRPLLLRGAGIDSQDWLVSYSVLGEGSQRHVVVAVNPQPPCVVRNLSDKPVEVTTAVDGERRAVLVDPGTEEACILDAGQAAPDEVIEFVEVGEADDGASSPPECTLLARAPSQAWGEPLVLRPGEPTQLADGRALCAHWRGPTCVVTVGEGEADVVAKPVEQPLSALALSVRLSSLAVGVWDDERRGLRGEGAQDGGDSLPAEVLLLSLDDLDVRATRTAGSAVGGGAVQRGVDLRFGASALQLDSFESVDHGAVVISAKADDDVGLPGQRLEVHAVLGQDAGAGGLAGTWVERASVTLPPLVLTVDDALLALAGRAGTLAKGGKQRAVAPAAQQMPLGEWYAGAVRAEADGAGAARLYVHALEVGRVVARISVHVPPVDTHRSPLFLAALTTARPLLCAPAAAAQAALAHYVAEVILNAPGMLGSLELLGNPTRLVQSFSAGVRDLVALPLRGLRQGSPVAVAKGLYSGSGSLAWRLAEWSLSSTAGFSSSASRLLRRAVSSGDVAAPPGAEGLGAGLRGLRRGVAEGAVGVVREPYRGATSGTALGLLAGVSRGVLGVVAQPVSGALELVAHSAVALAHSTGVQRTTRARRAPRLAAPQATPATWRFVALLAAAGDEYHEGGARGAVPHARALAVELAGADGHAAPALLVLGRRALHVVPGAGAVSGRGATVSLPLEEHAGLREARGSHEVAVLDAKLCPALVATLPPDAYALFVPVLRDALAAARRRT